MWSFMSFNNLYKFFSCLLCQTVSVLDVGRVKADLTHKSDATPRVDQIQIIPVPQVVEIEYDFTSKAEIAAAVCGSKVMSLPEAGGKEPMPQPMTAEQFQCPKLMESKQTSQARQEAAILKLRTFTGSTDQC